MSYKQRPSTKSITKFNRVESKGQSIRVKLAWTAVLNSCLLISSAWFCMVDFISRTSCRSSSTSSFAAAAILSRFVLA